MDSIGPESDPIITCFQKKKVPLNPKLNFLLIQVTSTTYLPLTLIPTLT